MAGADNGAGKPSSFCWACSETYNGTDGFEEFDTIDKLFDYIQEELEKGLILNVKYHAKLGYPERVNIKFSFENHGQSNIVISNLSKDK